MASSSLTSTVGTFGLSAVGGYLFGPVGFAAGALLGSFLFGQGGPDVEGLRLGDLNVSASSYGGVIPRCYAVQKVAGQIIWATDIVEDKNTRKVGGGVFGGGQKVREYKYYANFAVLFAEGECDGLLRLWVGEKLIADFEAPPVTQTSFDSIADALKYFIQHERYRFRFYRGTADQEPDPLIVQHVDKEVGANATPGFRGMVYLVFERLPLDEFGNRIAPVTAEIAWAAEDEQARGSFEYGGIVFEEYRGRVGTVDFTDASKAHFFPVGVPGLFRQYNAPADFVETANTIGLPRYAKQAVDQQFARWVMLHVQSNPLPICTRPRVLIKGKRT